MKTHELKILPAYFDEIASGEKTFEVRKNDRDFCVGDMLKLREYDPDAYEYDQGYTGREIHCGVIYVLEGEDMAFSSHDEYPKRIKTGLKKGYAVLGISIIVEATGGEDGQYECGCGMRWISESDSKYCPRCGKILMIGDEIDGV